jgi:hypothetical protein
MLGAVYVIAGFGILNFVPAKTSSGTRRVCEAAVVVLLATGLACLAAAASGR